MVVMVVVVVAMVVGGRGRGWWSLQWSWVLLVVHSIPLPGDNLKKENRQ